MEQQKTGVQQNKMAVVPMAKLIWQLGLPMIASMILQSVYNIVDTVFVINMGEEGVTANLALTYAFPVQILMIAVGVGSGIGINALISKSLGEGDRERASKVVGNGLFLTACFYVVFMLFGVFGAKWFITLMAGGYSAETASVIEMGTSYMQIVCIVSIGSIGFAFSERFLQATGKTNLSTIAQIAGAGANIVLDPIFIYDWGLGLGIRGAAWATVAGQIISLSLALIFHYTKNKEIGKSFKYVKPDWGIIKGIYAVGISAIIIQALPTVMTICVNAILGIHAQSSLLQGAYGIYYKIYQFPLFALFGLSNTVITVLSFNYGMGDKERCKQAIKWGVIASFIVAVIMVIIFEALANPLARLFGMASGEGSAEIMDTIAVAMRIAATGYIFMALSVAVQGVLQAFRYSVQPALLVALRQLVFTLPFVYLFVMLPNTTSNVWWSFAIAEFLGAFVAAFMLWLAYKRKIVPMQNGEVKSCGNLVITISREHGTRGNYIGELVAKKLGVGFYNKEIAEKLAEESGLANEYLDGATQDGAATLSSLYLSTEANQNAIIAQAKLIRKIAETESCVIVGRGADFILKDYCDCISVFIYADKNYRINSIKEIYGDDDASAEKHMKQSDAARGKYYRFISGMEWGDKSHYDFCIDASVGAEVTADRIVELVKSARGEYNKTA